MTRKNLCFLFYLLLPTLVGDAVGDEMGGFYNAKIICPTDGCPLKKIRRHAVEIVVQGPGYLIVKLKEKQTHLLGFVLHPAREGDYIRRFLRVFVESKADINFLGGVGVDIFQVGDGYVSGAALDGAIEKIEDAGLEYEFIPQP